MDLIVDGNMRLSIYMHMPSTCPPHCKQDRREKRERRAQRKMGNGGALEETA